MRRPLSEISNDPKISGSDSPQGTGRKFSHRSNALNLGGMANKSGPLKRSLTQKHKAVLAAILEGAAHGLGVVSMALLPSHPATAALVATASGLTKFAGKRLLDTERSLVPIAEL